MMPDRKCLRAETREPHRIHEWYLVIDGELHTYICPGYRDPEEP